MRICDSAESRIVHVQIDARASAASAAENVPVGNVEGGAAELEKLRLSDVEVLQNGDVFAESPRATELRNPARRVPIDTVGRADEGSGVDVLGVGIGRIPGRIHQWDGGARSRREAGARGSGGSEQI